MGCLAAIIATVIVEGLELFGAWLLVYSASKAFDFDYNKWHVIFVWVAISALYSIFAKARSKKDD